MRNIVVKVVFAAALCAAAAGSRPASAAQVDLGISIADGRLRSFYVAVGDHYRVAPRLVVDYRTRYRLLDDELPVVFFLAARAHVPPQAVIDLRLGKRSWFAIALHYGLSPEIFFVPVRLERIGPPYGNAYGYYRKHGRAGDWRKLALSDREVMDLVNLRFLSEYHGVAADAVIGWRGEGRSFVAIHEEAGRGRSRGPQAGKPKGGKPPKGDRK